MASIAGIHGDPIGDIRHDLRERSTYKNEDIDPERTEENYILTKYTKGTTSGEIYSYYNEFIADTYHRGKTTITAAEVVCTMPKELAKEKEEGFFQSSAQFLTEYLFNGDTSRVLLATVHKDEAGMEPHMHFQFVLPETENKAYISAKDKFLKGIESIEKEYGNLTDPQKAQLVRAVNDYTRSGDINEAIHQTADAMSLDRDDARRAFLKIRRTDKEMYDTKLMSKDEFLTKKLFEDFHPAYQKWMDEHGPKCTVYQGGGTINIPVAQLKEMTRETGVTLDHGLTPKELGELIKLRDHTHNRGIRNHDRQRNKERGDRIYDR